MNGKSKRIREAFRAPLHVPVKITAQGFEVFGDLVPELFGRVTRLTLVRKLFEEGILTCMSQDGFSGSNGKVCDDCRNPECLPRLRIQLVSSHVFHLLELPSSSAKNLFTMEDAAERQGARLWDWPLRLTIENRGHWGEVRFERASQRPSTPSSPV